MSDPEAPPPPAESPPATPPPPSAASPRPDPAAPPADAPPAPPAPPPVPLLTVQYRLDVPIALREQLATFVSQSLLPQLGDTLPAVPLAPLPPDQPVEFHQAFLVDRSTAAEQRWGLFAGPPAAAGADDAVDGDEYASRRPGPPPGPPPADRFADFEAAEEEQARPRFRPGALSSELRAALGMPNPSDCPPFLNRMRAAGYPPGYLVAGQPGPDKDKTQLAVYDSAGDYAAADAAASRPPFQFDPAVHRASARLPGVNAPIGPWETLDP